MRLRAVAVLALVVACRGEPPPASKGAAPDGNPPVAPGTAAPSVASSAPSTAGAKATVNGLALAFEAWPARVTDLHDLHFRATFTNASGKPLRLFAMFLEHLVLYMKVRRADDQTPVSPSWAPMPRADDGSGRIDLAPGESHAFDYKGTDYFQSLAPGRYEARFVYESGVEKSGEWQGQIETPWVAFEMGK